MRWTFKSADTEWSRGLFLTWVGIIQSVLQRKKSSLPWRRWHSASRLDLTWHGLELQHQLFPGSPDYQHSLQILGLPASTITRGQFLRINLSLSLTLHTCMYLGKHRDTRIHTPHLRYRDKNMHPDRHHHPHSLDSVWTQSRICLALCLVSEHLGFRSGFATYQLALWPFTKLSIITELRFNALQFKKYQKYPIHRLTVFKLLFIDYNRIHSTF